MPEGSPEREFASDIEQKLVEHIEANAEIQDLVQRIENGKMTKEELLAVVGQWNEKNHVELQGMYADKTFFGPDGLSLRILMDEKGNLEMRA